MANIKVTFRPSAENTQEGTLHYLVIHRNVSRQIATGYRLYRHEWDEAACTLALSATTSGKRRAYLASLAGFMANDMAALHDIVSRLKRDGAYTADNVVSLYRQLHATDGIISFAEGLIAGMRRVGRERTAERYTTVLNSFKRFMGDSNDIPLKHVDAGLMLEYETFLRSRGLCPNSSSFYMRGLRAIYTRAVEQGLAAQNHPFRYVYTGIDKTVKRAVPMAVIRHIRNLNLILNPAMDYARDMFMFSFYTRGMSFVDMAFLRKSDLRNGILSYRRRKTGQQLSIRWERPMQEILDKYDTSATPYLLPVIRQPDHDEYRQYRNAAHLINAKLRLLGQRLGLDMPLTMYVARHGWASIARNENIPISIISEAMGHDSESTTRIYLTSLDNSLVDKANSIILN